MIRLILSANGDIATRGESGQIQGFVRLSFRSCPPQYLRVRGRDLGLGDARYIDLGTTRAEL